MKDNMHECLIDYKFFCFNGIPKLLYISEGLENHATARISFFDTTGKLLPFYRKDYKPFKNDMVLPDNYNEMLNISEKIAKATAADFVRVDLYSIDGRTYFSEITFYPNAGFIPFEPDEWDMKIGKYLVLSN